MSRLCGGCQACCYVLAVTELTKPKLTACPNACEAQCKIYESRPAVCRGYECMWLNEEYSKALDLGDEMRPDKIGVILTAPDHVSPVGPILMVHEIHEGAHEEYWADKLLKRLRKRHLMVMIYGDQTRKMIGPTPRLRQAHEFLMQLERDASLGKGKTSEPA